MSFQPNSTSKSQKIFEAHHKAYMNLKISLKKKLNERKDLKLSTKTISSQGTSPALRRPSATRPYKTPTKLYRSATPLNPEPKTSENLPSTSSTYSLDFKDTLESSISHPRPISTQSQDYYSEILSCKQEINTLKCCLSKLQRPTAKICNKRPYSSSRDEDLQSRLSRQRDWLERKHKTEMQRQKEKLTRAFEKQCAEIHQDVTHMVREEERRGIEEREREIHEYYKHEISLMEKESEAKLKLKVNNVKAEYEGVVKRAKEENLELKRLVETLRSQCEDFTAKNDAIRVLKQNENFFSSPTFDNKEFCELSEKYTELQRDYLQLKRKRAHNLCTKCKAFTETDEVLNKRLATIRNYINSS